MSKKRLREGFTTGSAATAAAMAALNMLLKSHNKAQPSYMHIPCPAPHTAKLKIPIAFANCIGIGQALGIVKKDGGDDPDATHGASIHANIQLNNNIGQIHIKGGKGVGRFTLPGLPLPVGEVAINPAPRQQIRAGLQDIAKAYAYAGGIEVSISVPEGEKIAKKTFNERLGIVGGISILGTQGTVKPFSHAAWKATITQSLQVASATGCENICLTTGRRSERLLLNLYTNIPEHACIQVADFAQYSLQETRKFSFKQILWACFFGKLVKLAQGHAYTHAHTSQLDFELLAKWCVSEGLEDEQAEQITQCVTANHALNIIMSHENYIKILEYIAKKAAITATTFAGQSVKIHLFHLDGRILVKL